MEPLNSSDREALAAAVDELMKADGGFKVGVSLRICLPQSFRVVGPQARPDNDRSE